MIASLIALFRRPEPVVDMADLIIAKRASECRRSEAVAEAYRRKHSILKQGQH